MDYWVNGITNFISKNTKKIHDIIDSLLKSYNSESETTISKGSTQNYEIILPNDKSNLNESTQVFLKDSDEEENSEEDYKKKDEESIHKNNSNDKEEIDINSTSETNKSEILNSFLEIENKAQKEKLKLLENLLMENKILKKKLKEKEEQLEKYITPN